MALSKEKLQSMLDNEETDYTKIVKLVGTENVEHLKEFAKSRNVMRAQKAIYLASMMEDNVGLPVLEIAALSRVAVKRIAVASGLSNLKSGTGKSRLSEQLIRSSDVSVQKLVLGSVKETDKLSRRFKLQVEALSKRGGLKQIKDLSKVALKKIK